MSLLTVISHKLNSFRKVFQLAGILALLLILVANASLITSHNDILKLYATPTILPKSSTFSVTVNGKSAFVHQYNAINYVHFSFAGTADIEINYKEPVNTYILSPKSFEIPSRKDNETIFFSLQVPRKLILHKVNEQDEQLYILADPLEEYSPQLGSPNVTNLLNYNVDNTGIKDATNQIQKAINDASAHKGVLYVPPGAYKTKQLNLKSNLILYLAGGAVLEGTKEINPSYGQGILQLDNVSNVKIMGRGALHGNGSYWRPRGGWYTLIKMSNVNNVLLQDIIILDPAVANVWIEYSENCNIYNAKVLSAPEPNFVNTDGFDFWSSRNITIDNVLYKGTDDATSHGGDIKGRIRNNENINIKNSIFYNSGTGGAFAIGISTNQDYVRNVTYENIDVVYTNALTNMWAFAKAHYENIYFKNIRLEDVLDKPMNPDYSASLFNFRIMDASTWEPNSSPTNLGRINNVYFQNLRVDDPGGEQSKFQGYDSQRDIEGVRFNNFWIKSKLITTSQDAFFNLLPSEKDGKVYVKLDFMSSQSTIVNITSKNLYADVNRQDGEFLITRRGNKSHDLSVKYEIRGTAENGKDYQNISNTATIHANQDSVNIKIKPIRNNKINDLKTVFLSLENLPNSTNYMIGSSFHAVVNILNS